MAQNGGGKIMKDKQAQTMQDQLMTEVTGLARVLADQMNQMGVNNAEKDTA
jgi:hypothetical protein